MKDGHRETQPGPLRCSLPTFKPEERLKMDLWNAGLEAVARIHLKMLRMSSRGVDVGGLVVIVLVNGPPGSRHKSCPGR
jgi:hypothetical protein